ncbi:Isoquinoline 1-oxidoreductase subunit [Xanthobacter aminoxidans]|uniref:Isoquinoline 1-oxidoreductase subunit n=1 Tax=Xanthobacter aminoxidans TaxID=186280 RepID=UPI00372A3A6D
MLFDRRLAITLPAAALAGLLAAAGIALSAPAGTLSAPAGTLAPPDAFAAIADTAQRSAAYFSELSKVLTHPRCTNCHPATDRPRQGDSARLHQPPVTRGADGFGTASLRCGTCHHGENYAPAGVPGHPEWHLAPAEMAWEGKSPAEICIQIKDQSRNGGRSLADLITHIGDDTLVGWAWHPGGARTPAPGSQQEAKALVKAWVESGAACPK